MILSGHHIYYTTKSLSLVGEVKDIYSIEVVYIDQTGISINVELNLSEGASASVSIRGISFADTSLSTICRIGKDSSSSSLSIEQAAFAAPGGSVTFYPAMEINNGKIKADHKAYLYKLDEKALNYLESRGMSKKKAELLLLLSFLRIDKSHPLSHTVEQAYISKSRS